jgi:hypothetical protein
MVTMTTTIVSRRAMLIAPLAAGLAMTATPSAAAMRAAIKGVASRENFNQFASFVSDQLDKGAFGMDVFIPKAAGLVIDDPELLILAREDVSKLAREGGGEAFQLSARTGYKKVAKGIYFGGLYEAEYSGLFQGITAIIIKPQKTGQDVVDSIPQADQLTELR